jgi:xylitol oxidase
MTAALTNTRIRAVGTRMSFNDISDTSGTQVSLAKFNTIEIRGELKRVSVGAGVTFGTLADALEQSGFALQTLPSYAKANVVGSILTGSHGGGAHKKGLSSYVKAIEYVDVNG